MSEGVVVERLFDFFVVLIFGIKIFGHDEKFKKNPPKNKLLHQLHLPPKAEEEIKKPCLTSIDIISGRLFYFKVEIIVYCIRKIENCNTYIFPQFTTELLAKKTNHQLVTKFTNHLVTFYLIAILALDRIVGIQFAEKKKMKKKIK